MKKIFTLLALTAAMFVGGAQQAQAKYVYFQPNSNWTQAGDFYVYAYGSEPEWVALAKVTNEDIENYSNLNSDSYKANINDDNTTIIFCRVNETPDWEHVWNQSEDIEYVASTKWIMNDGVWGKNTGNPWGATKASVLPYATYTVTFTNDGAWDNVYAYTYGGDGGEILGAWPGTKVTTVTDNVYTLTCKLTTEEIPASIIFNNNNGEQTKNFTFADGAAYKYGSNEYYLVLSNDDFYSDFTVNQMTEATGVYTSTIDNKPGYKFVIAPYYALNETNTGIERWAKVLRASETENDHKWIEFASFSFEPKSSSNGGNWYIPASNDAGKRNNDGTINLTYTKSTNKLDVACTHAVTIGSTGYATYSNAYKYVVPSGLTAYTVVASGEKATLTAIEAGTIIPAYQGVILKGAAGNYNITSADYEAAAGTIGTNELHGTGNNAAYHFRSDYVGYILYADETHDLGFYKTQNETYLPIHKAYLEANDLSANFLGFTFDDESTGISSVSASSKGTEIYNLAGQRQQSLKKGLNIVNGKKVLVK